MSQTQLHSAAFSPVFKAMACVALCLALLTHSNPALAGDKTPAKSIVATSPLKTQSVPHGLRGMWVWRPESIETPEARTTLINTATQYGFNRLLLQIHYVPGSVAAGKPQIRNPEAIRALLSDAAAKFIFVEALDGGADMALATNYTKGFANLDAIIAFDAALPTDARFVGIHYDIQPYTLPAWKTADRGAIMVEYLTFLSTVKTKVNMTAPHWTVACDIPFWYGLKNSPTDTCIVEFNGQTKNLQDHIQDLTDYVGVASYRRHVMGANSVLSVTDGQLNYAKKIGKTICPSFEIGELKETPTITFFGTPPSDFWTQNKLLEDLLKDNPAFGGVLVHSYEHLHEYLGDTTPPK